MLMQLYLRLGFLLFRLMRFFAGPFKSYFSSFILLRQITSNPLFLADPNFKFKTVDLSFRVEHITIGNLCEARRIQFKFFNLHISMRFDYFSGVKKSISANPKYSNEKKWKGRTAAHRGSLPFFRARETKVHSEAKKKSQLQ